MSNQTTKEQRKARAQERREKMRALASSVAKMSAAERAELAARFSGVTIEGRTLSGHNQCLLALQIPLATIVGGFQQWIKAGRIVKKGEHGASIWIPLGPKDENGNVHLDDERRFMTATIFDISQTAELEGKEGAAHKMAADVRRTVDSRKSNENIDSEFEVAA
jgi:hypothetical protein